jgi:hypothetical protein
MRGRVEWTPAETVPWAGEVLRLQGIPADAGPTPRIAALLEFAMAVYRQSAEPRAVFSEISPEAFAAVYRGEGRNARETPLGIIFPKADRLALFTATIGAHLTDRIRAYFDRNEPALAVMLDSVASAAADHLTELLRMRYLTMIGTGDTNGSHALAYSPGYCGWHVTGQRALFDFLKPGDVGVALHPSCLMEPLKSVSGVLVVGPGAIHRFPPDYPFCEDCSGRPCRARIASLTGP